MKKIAVHIDKYCKEIHIGDLVVFAAKLSEFYPVLGIINHFEDYLDDTNNLVSYAVLIVTSCYGKSIGTVEYKCKCERCMLISQDDIAGLKIINELNKES